MVASNHTSISRTYKNQIFEYDAIDKKNNRTTGEITAISLPRARSLLQNQGLTILKLTKKSRFSFKGIASKVTNEQITLFSRQMATMLNAGIPLVQGLGIISEGNPSNALGALTRSIKVDVESGSAFSIALKKHPEYFNQLYCNLVESGEQSGSLDTMLNRIALYQEKTDSLRRKVKKALYYPTAVIIISAIVTYILLVKVVPTFKEMFKGFGAELPTFTTWVLHVSDIVQAYGLYIIGALITLIIIAIRCYQTKLGFRHIVQRLSLKLPIFGGILRKTIIARFARTLSTTSAAGVPLTEALGSVAKAASNIVYSTAIEQIKDGITAGQQMRTIMKRNGIFPIMVVQMIGIGEESGMLESMLEKVANIYEEEVDTAVDGLTTLLEPLIMVLLGLIVGGLVVAMYLPIFKMGALM